MSKKLINAIKYCFSADRFVDNERAKGNLNLPHVSLAVIGPKATGKTVAVKTAAAEIAKTLEAKLVEHANPGEGQFGYVRMSFAGKDSPGEANGLQEIVEGQTVILAHANFPRSGRGILHIEEFNRVLPQIAPLLQELPDQHMMDVHQLPAGWTVIFTGNPASDEVSGENYSVTEVFDSSFFNRLITVSTDITHEEALAYGMKQGWSRYMVNYMAMKAEEARAPFDIERALPGMLVENQRTRQTVSTLLEGDHFAWNVMDLPPLDQAGEVLTYLVSGAMGRSSAVAFISSMRVGDRPLDASDVLDTYTTGHQVVAKDEVTGTETTEVNQAMVRRWSDPDNRSSQAVLAHITVERVLAYMQANKMFDHQLDNLGLFLGDLRRDEVQFFIRTAQQTLPVMGDKYLDLVQKYSESNMEVLAGAMRQGRVARAS